MRRKLLVISGVAVALLASVTNVFEPRPVYTPWRLATAQRMTDEGRRVHAKMDLADKALLFETPLMTRQLALHVRPR